MKNQCRHRLPAVVAFSVLLAPISLHGEGLRQAVVTQKVNQVTLAPSLDAQARPVSAGAVVREKNVVRTGSKSRAELEFGDKTLARIDAESIFSFDATSRTLDFERGAILFSKPKNGERVNIRSKAITAAITGSTAFVSLTPAKVRPDAPLHPEVPAETMLLGMVEGKMKGRAAWSDKGKLRRENFKLEPGDMLVSEPGRRPVVVQFDLPRFLRTSPLITGFEGELTNHEEIEKEAEHYADLQRRGFIEPTNVLAASHESELLFVAMNQDATEGLADRFDAGTTLLAGLSELAERGHLVTPGVITPGGFQPVGGTGIIRGQIVYRTSADLDLHLILPDMTEIFFGNRTVTFNNGQATATLDADNRGGVINLPPDFRIENIVVNGNPAPGDYRFFVRNFSTPNVSDNVTLTVTGDGGATTQVLNFDLPARTNTPEVIVTVP